MRILLLLSGVYPHYMGGVSTWTNQLVSKMRDFEFIIISVVSNPHVEIRYPIPPNVKEIVTIPLWGSDRPEEYDDRPLHSIIKRNRKTSENAIESEFIPHFRVFLEECISGGINPENMGNAFREMHRFFVKYDFKVTMRSKALWENCLEILGGNPLLGKMNSNSLVNICRSLDRYLRILAFPIPRVNLSHCAIAGIAGVMGVLAKIERGVPFILTEHGVWFRERLLDIINLSLDPDPPAKFFWVNFFKALTRVNYHYADAIYPVCHFNVRWEDEIGRNNLKEVIYNGVDTDRFRPMDIPRLNDGPTVVGVIRLDRFKDPLNLIQAMSYVVDAFPEEKPMALIWGPSPDEDYAMLCAKTVERKNLQNNVRFMGFTREPEKAYNMGDVVVMPSLTEGFPFALIEAMACGKPIVATDVGGIKEALGGCGILVPPRSPRFLAEAIIELIKDRKRASKLGQKARERVINNFSSASMIENYRSIYNKKVAECS